MADLEQAGVDSAMSVQTPEGIEFILYPAGLLIRACAWAIDAFFQMFLFIVIAIIAGIFSWVLGTWFLLILVFLLNWFYHVAFEVFGRGQSPGKRFMGIQVVCRDGSPVTPGASFLRNLLRFADTFFSLYLIAFICMLTSKGFRRLGDWVGDTLVVYTDYTRFPGRFTSPFLRRSNLPWLEGVPLAYPRRHLNYEEKQAILSFARRYPLLGKARSDEIAKNWAVELGAPDSDSEMDSSVYLLGIARALGG